MPRKNMKQSEIDREMNNRVAFIDFVRGLLNINPLERWSPQQAKLHPFITQQKYTGPFIPPMNLKPGNQNRSPAPGTQQQQQAESLSRQRAQAAQAQAQAQVQAQQAHVSSQPAYNQSGGVSLNQYNQPIQPQAPQQPVYNNNNMYAQNTTHQAPPPPPYPSQQPVGYTQMGMMNQPPAQMPPAQYGGQQQQSLYAQASIRAGRQRASTMEVQQGGIPVAIQRVASHLDPNQPIRLQPSPAYYPPPPEGAASENPGSARRRGSRAATGQTAQQQRSNRDFIRNLEDRTLEEGFMGQSQWH